MTALATALSTATTPTVLPAQLIEKYSVAGPRYTSYPTALMFTEDFGADDYQQRLQKARKAVAGLSLYVHLPFCRRLCYYCACNKVVTKDPEAAERYLQYLKREIELVSNLTGKRRPVNQLHFGGGTPTFLSDSQLIELVHSLASHFNISDSDRREYSIEIDPRTVTADRLALLRGLGFNRLSFGVQDTDPDVQQAINRVQSTAELTELVGAARAYRFRSISFDLIYGLPRQSCQTLSKTLDDVIALEPERISLYQYAHLPDRFPPQRAIERQTLPSSAEKLAMLQLASKTLADAGYQHIGMDHFVRNDDDLAICQRAGRLQRNFQGYSTAMAPDLIGLGVSSISEVGDCFAQNAKDLDQYYHALEQNQLPTERGCSKTWDDEVRGYIIKELACNLHLSSQALLQRFGLSLSEAFADELKRLESFVQDGLVELSAAGIQVTETGRMMLRNVCMVFDQYLDTHPGKYSKTL